jgi:hypothetical protein
MRRWIEQKAHPKKRGLPWRETMKTMLLAAAAALSLGVGSAYAGDGDGPVANTQFTELPRVVAQAPVQNAPAVATARNGQAIGTYVTHSVSASPFLLNNTK